MDWGIGEGDAGRLYLAPPVQAPTRRRGLGDTSAIRSLLGYAGNRLRATGKVSWGGQSWLPPALSWDTCFAPPEKAAAGKMPAPRGV